MYDANSKGIPTPSIAVLLYEMTRPATFGFIFELIDLEIERLCLTQHQIINFIKQHTQWLQKDGNSTFFLFKLKGNYFVAGLDFEEKYLLKAFVNRLEDTIDWGMEGRPRVVVPHLVK